MLSIQEVGTQVLGNNPKSFYIFTGPEYGVKRKYIEHLKQYYGTVAVVDHVDDILVTMRKKHMIPLKPKLYIVRYDEEFISSINDKTAASIAKTNIIGTIVCLYEQVKSATKCDKYLSEYTVSFDKINPVFIKKYLRSDFPEISDNLIDIAVQIDAEYIGAYNICHSLSYLPADLQRVLTLNEVRNTVGYSPETDDIQLRYAFASRNVQGCFNILNHYAGEPSQLFYVMLSALIELEKILTNPRQKSDLSKYTQGWDLTKVHNMFVHIFDELDRSRGLSYYDVHTGIEYCIELLATSGG